MRRVTEILSDCGLRGDIPFVTAESQEFYFQRGTLIHKACCMVDSGTLDWDSLDPQIAGHVKAYAKFIDDVRPEVCESELKVSCKRLNYMGHLDRVFRICGVYVLCDLKTSSVDLATRLQTMAYRLAWNKRRCARMGLALHANGTYKATYWRQAVDDTIDQAGWEHGCVPKNERQIAIWKARVGWKEKT